MSSQWPRGRQRQLEPRDLPDQFPYSRDDLPRFDTGEMAPFSRDDMPDLSRDDLPRYDPVWDAPAPWDASAVREQRDQDGSPWQDSGWRVDEGGAGRPAVGPGRRGSHQAGAQRPSPPLPGRAGIAGPADQAGRDATGRRPASYQREQSYQGDWDRPDGGSADEADYGWIQYLTGGRSGAEPSAPAGPSIHSGTSGLSRQSQSAWPEGRTNPGDQVPRPVGREAPPAERAGRRDWPGRRGRSQDQDEPPDWPEGRPGWRQDRADPEGWPERGADRLGWPDDRADRRGWPERGADRQGWPDDRADRRGWSVDRTAPGGWPQDRDDPAAWLAGRRAEDGPQRPGADLAPVPTTLQDRPGRVAARTRPREAGRAAPGPPAQPVQSASAASSTRPARPEQPAGAGPRTIVKRRGSPKAALTGTPEPAPSGGGLLTADPEQRAASAAVRGVEAPSRLSARPASPAVSGRQARRKRARGRRRLFRVIAGVVIAAVAVVGATAIVLARKPVRFADAITAPAQFGAFTAQPALARKMDAVGLRRQIVAQSNGEAHNVVDTVYETAAGRGNRSSSDILLFIGGNLSGTSATAFISSFRGKATGVVSASAGAMGGKAACIPAASGGLAECAWADQDTFGVVASPTLSPAQLAADLLSVRTVAEHRAGH